MHSIFVLILNLRDGGAMGVISDVCNNLPANISVQVVTVEKTDIKYKLNKKSISLPIVRPKILPQAIASLWKIPLGIIFYVKLLRENKPSVSWSILGIDNFINIIACKLIGIKSITSFRSDPFSPYDSTVNIIFGKISLYFSIKYSDKIITNSMGVKQDILKKYGDRYENKLSVIYNPKNIEMIYELMNENIENKFFQDSIPIIITTGRLVRSKGQWHLLRIFSEIRKNCMCKLVICGDGPMKEYLESLAMELGIIDDVLFLGWCDNPYKYIAHSAVFAFPSLTESQPNSLIDAVICGCPIVSTDCKHGPREILGDNEYGLLSAELDNRLYDVEEPLTSAEIDMKNKILLLMSDVNLRNQLSLKSKSRAEIFSKDKLMEKYYETILSVCKSDLTDSPSSIPYQ